MVDIFDPDEPHNDHLTRDQTASPGDDATDDSDSVSLARRVTDRRGFIRGVGLASTMGFLGLSATSARAGPVEESNMTEVHVNVSPGEEVSGIVEGVNSGELLVFPSGRFQWSSLALVTVDDWGLRCQPDTVFEVPAGWGDGDKGMILKTVGGGRTADNFLLENLTFDSPGRAAPHLRLGVRNAAHVDGLHYRMNGPLSNQLHGAGITAFVTNSTGTLRVDDYRQFNNGDLGGYGGGNSRIGIYVGPSNNGTVHLANPVLQGFPNNACYVARQPGEVIVDGGLLMNNNVSAVRVSGNVEVRDTTIVIDIDRYLEGPGVLDASAHNARGLWGDARAAGSAGGHISGVSVVLNSYRRCTGLVENGLDNPWLSVENSQFLLNTANEAVKGDSGEVEVTNCTFDGSASATAGIGDISGSGNYLDSTIDPGQVTVQSYDNESFDWSLTHPETPGSGTDSGSGTDTSLDRTLTVDGTDADHTNYEITVSGELQKNSNVGSINDTDVIDGGTVSGFVNGGVDGYRFSGDVSEVRVDGGATVLVDGQPVDVDGPILNRTLTIEGSGDRSDYAFTVNDGLAATNASLEDEDSISGTSAEGFVVGWPDEFRFAGEVTEFSLDGDATVLVDGEAVDPASLGTDSQLPRTLTIDGSGDRSDYAFTVSDGLTGINDSIGTGDSIDGTTAEGFVVGWADEFRFAGEVTEFSLDGDATVLVDGEAVDPASTGLPNRLIIDGRGTDGETSYEIDVSGDLQIDPLLGATDGLSVDGTAVTSTVIDGRDAFAFSGDLTKLFIDGDADITLEDNDG